MRNTSNVEIGDKELIEFMVKDFEEISSKLESTDKKIQFFTQVYITIITAIIAAITAGLTSVFGDESSLIAISDVYPLLGIIVFVFYLIGQFVLLYMLSGQKIHTDYVCRLNMIRLLVLMILNKSDDFIELYGYTGFKAPKKTGMNDWMAYLIIITNLIFLSLACYFAYLTNKIAGVCLIIIALGVIIANIYYLSNHYEGMKETVKKYKDNKESLEERLNETR